MRVAVVIPVGPGHEELAKRAAASVYAAWEATHGPFHKLELQVVDDTKGAMGRSRARNLGMDESPADWHFLLDADDEMCPDTFGLVDRSVAATFGAVCLSGKVRRWDRWPCTRETILRYGPRGTLSMGCFVRGDLGLRFDESLDVAEDFDFYLRLPSFMKRAGPLVSIGYDQPSAGGPRGYEGVDWLAACGRVIERYRTVTA